MNFAPLIFVIEDFKYQLATAPGPLHSCRTIVTQTVDKFLQI